MINKRYEIQFAYVSDVKTLTDGSATWYSLHAGASRSRKRALNNWRMRVLLNQEQKIFRLFDNKTGRVIR